MKVCRYDETVDALYIKLGQEKIVDTQEVQPGVMVDLDANGKVVGVEVLDFQARLNQDSEAQTHETVQSGV